MFRFKRSTKKNDMQVLLDEISDGLDDIRNDLDDIRSDLNELHEIVKEGLRLTLIVQEQCQELINMIEKNKGEKNE